MNEQDLACVSTHTVFHKTHTSAYITNTWQTAVSTASHQSFNTEWYPEWMIKWYTGAPMTILNSDLTVWETVQSSLQNTESWPRLIFYKLMSGLRYNITCEKQRSFNMHIMKFDSELFALQFEQILSNLTSWELGWRERQLHPALIPCCRTLCIIDWKNTPGQNGVHIL